MVSTKRQPSRSACPHTAPVQMESTRQEGVMWSSHEVCTWATWPGKGGRACGLVWKNCIASLSMWNCAGEYKQHGCLMSGPDKPDTGPWPHGGHPLTVESPRRQPDQNTLPQGGDSELCQSSYGSFQKPLWNDGKKLSRGSCGPRGRQRLACMYKVGKLNTGLLRKGRKGMESRHPDVEDRCPLGLPPFPRTL